MMRRNRDGQDLVLADSWKDLQDGIEQSRAVLRADDGLDGYQNRRLDSVVFGRWGLPLELDGMFIFGQDHLKDEKDVRKPLRQLVRRGSGRGDLEKAEVFAYVIPQCFDGAFEELLRLLEEDG